eukprot:674063-Hanusia_phi.AAC.1
MEKILRMTVAICMNLVADSDFKNRLSMFGEEKTRGEYKSAGARGRRRERGNGGSDGGGKGGRECAILLRRRASSQESRNSKDWGEAGGERGGDSGKQGSGIREHK